MTSARGYNPDVWTHKGYAYVGRWGFSDGATGNSRFCLSASASGVAVVDARNPSSPRRLSTLQNPAGSSAEDVVVYTARYGPYAGRDIAVAGIQWCAGSRYDLTAERGLMLWDVTQPAPDADRLRADRVLHARRARVPGAASRRSRPDVRLRERANVALPRRPAGERGARRAWRRRLPPDRHHRSAQPAADVRLGDPGHRRSVQRRPGCDADANYGHGAEPSEDGRSVFLSYWEAGSSSSTSARRRSRSSGVALSIPATPTATPTPRSTTRPAGCSSSRTRTSARRPAPGSRRASATCACTTGPSPRRRSRSASTGRRTR